MKSTSVITGLLIKKHPPLGFQELETLLELIPEAAIVIDIGESRLIAANGLAVALAAYTRKELLGQPVDNLLHPFEGQPRLSEALRRIFPPSSFQCSLGKRSGLQIEVDLKIKYTGPSNEGL